jgi:hypothetical protein
MAGDIRAAWEHLGAEVGEAVVLSTVYETTTATPVLMAASLLVGPAAIAAGGWPAWRAEAGFRPAPGEEALKVPATFIVELESAIAGRVTMDQSEAYGWLRRVLEDGVCSASGQLPGARAHLGPARSPIRVCTQSNTAAGDLATWLTRPIIGFHFPRTDEPAGVEAGDSWTVGDAEIPVTAAIDLLGMSWFDSKHGAAPSGLLLGRFERRAWLAGQRLVPENDLYTVQIGIDPDLAELADLEIEVEEHIGDELVLGERLLIEDTDIREAQRVLYGPKPTTGRLEIGVALPTLGRGVKRSVHLYHRDGTLLDEWLSFNLVERMTMTMTVNGGEQPPITIGERRGPQDLVELLGAVERARSQYAALRRDGSHNRIFEDIERGGAVLRAILERAPGELLVLDAYFRDWSLLADLGGPPPRVLIGPDVDRPPEDFVGRCAQWRTKPPPFHDRFFLWEAGGVSVGTSAGAVHDRLFRIVRIGPAEAEVLRDRFSQWWSDPGFDHL